MLLQIQRVVDLLVERKNVNDLCSCLISPSKSHPPLKFFEAQMYKLQHCGLENKVFLLVSSQLVETLDLAMLAKISWPNVSRKVTKTTDDSSI